MTGGGHRRPACERCHDSGLVVGDRAVNDSRLAGGRRLVAEVYRCSCPAGDRVSKAFAREPLPALPAGRRP